MIRLLINGCHGKVGRTLIQMASGDDQYAVVAGVDKFPDAAKVPFPVYGHIGDCGGEADVVIDFSRPEALPSLLDWCKRYKKPIIVATTGLSREDHQLMHEAAAAVPVFQAANMSLGVNLMMDLSAQAAAFLGDDFDVEIIEMHHNQKVDAPSGTALALADAMNEVLLQKKNYVYGRHTRTEKRTHGEMGIHAIRGGTLAGEHQVHFIGTDEVLELRHSAQSKQIFALGALRAAAFLKDKPAGFYTMKDLLLENSTVTNLYTNDDEALCSLYGLPGDGLALSTLLSALADGQVNLDMISQTAPADGMVSVSFTLAAGDVDRAVELIGNALRDIAGKIDVQRDIAKLSVEGPGMARQAGVASRMLTALSGSGVAVYAITTSETKISCCVPKSHEKAAIETILKTFNL